MSDCVARIEKLTNGFVVEVVDTEQQEKNRDPKNKGPWVDPWKSFAFKDAAEVVAFLTSHLDNLKPEDSADDEYAAAWAKTATDDEA